MLTLIGPYMQFVCTLDLIDSFIKFSVQMRKKTNLSPAVEDESERFWLYIGLSLMSKTPRSFAKFYKNPVS